MSLNITGTTLTDTSYKAPIINKNTSNKKLMDVSKEFESIFIGQVFKEMNKSTFGGEKSSMFYGGMAEDIFKDMLYNQYSLDIAKHNSIGLAKMVYNALTTNKENSL